MTATTPANSADATTTDETGNRLPVAVGIPLNGLDEAFRLAKNLAVASVLPDSLRGKPSDVLAIVLYGQELGLAPMQAIDRKSTRLNSSHYSRSRMPSSA